MKDELTGAEYWSEANWLYICFGSESSVGKQKRLLGTLAPGPGGARILNVIRQKNHWHKKMGCWLVNAFVVEHCKNFRLAGFYLSGVRDFRLVVGYVPMQRLMGRPSYSMGGFEPQVQIRPEDLLKKAEAITLMAGFITNGYVPPLPEGQGTLDLEQAEANKKLNESIDAINEARRPGGRPMTEELFRREYLCEFAPERDK